MFFPLKFIQLNVACFDDSIPSCSMSYSALTSNFYRYFLFLCSVCQRVFSSYILKKNIRK